MGLGYDISLTHRTRDLSENAQCFIYSLFPFPMQLIKSHSKQYIFTSICKILPSYTAFEKALNLKAEQSSTAQIVHVKSWCSTEPVQKCCLTGVSDFSLACLPCAQVKRMSIFTYQVWCSLLSCRLISCRLLYF